MEIKLTVPKYARPLIEHLLLQFPRRVWMVGSEARALVLGLPMEESKDTDLIVEGASYAELRIALLGAPSCGDGTELCAFPIIERNSFGGWKYQRAGEKDIDVWSDHIADFLSEVPEARQGVAINLTSGVVLMTREFSQDSSGDSRIFSRPVRLPDGGCS